MIRRALVAWVAFAAPMAAAHVGPHPEAGVAFDQRIAARVPAPLAFTDMEGQRRTLRQAMDGRPAVLVLGYARCKDLCAVTVPAVAQALERTGLVPGRDYRAVFASIDAREGPPVLREAAERLPPPERRGWSFLGGNAGSARALADAVGFRYRYEPEHDAFAHPEGLVVLTPDGTVSRYLLGVRFEPSDLRLALAEAGQGRTGRLADRLLLLCYHFDPETGRYSARILDGLRIVAIAMFALAGAWLAWRLRRERAP